MFGTRRPSTPGAELSGEGAGECGIRIVTATEQDLSGMLAALQAESHAPRWTMKALQAFIARQEDANNRRSLIVAKTANGAMAGWLAASLVLDSTELEFVLVQPLHRGRGYGRQMLRAWLVWAVRGGAREAWLEVRPSNAAALQLYRELGFEEQGRRKNYYGNPCEDAVVMRLRLVSQGQDAGS